MFIKPVMCMKCKKTFATVKITKIVNGEVHELHLCQDCASKLSPYQKKMSNLQKDLNEILSGLLNQEKAAKHQPKEPQKENIDLVCDSCGFPFESYKKTFLLGCSQCYRVFHDHILSDIRKIHGDVNHAGKVPRRYKKIMELKRNLENLKQDLQGAVRDENFELAADLRDEIRELEEKQNTSINQ